MNRDQVYRNPQGQIVDFVFDELVADVFPDMIRRSVPGYEVVVPLSGLLAARQLEHCEHPRIYDLGCSLGASTLAVLRALEDKPASIIGVDASSAMIERASQHIKDPRVTFVEADIVDLAFEPCCAVLINYVLQFLTPDSRLSVLRRIHRCLEPGGILIVSEKIRFDAADDQAYYEAAHLDFKRANGYSSLEISQKRTALENVMIIDTQDEHFERFEAAGFSSSQKWFQCLNWASFLVRA